jgi:hypothetical protein
MCVCFHVCFSEWIDHQERTTRLVLSGSLSSLALSRGRDLDHVAIGWSTRIQSQSSNH